MSCCLGMDLAVGGPMEEGHELRGSEGDICRLYVHDPLRDVGTDGT